MTKWKEMFVTPCKTHALVKHEKIARRQTCVIHYRHAWQFVKSATNAEISRLHHNATVLPPRERCRPLIETPVELIATSGLSENDTGQWSSGTGASRVRLIAR